MKNLLGPILRRLTRYDAPNSPSWSPGTVGALTVLCLAGLGACVLSSSVGCYHADAPKTKARTATGLVCNSALWNFGDIDATIHPILSHSFTLENTSRTPITMDVRSTCGCIVLEGAQKTLVPGESTEVKVRLELSRVPGPVRRQLLVQTRTPDDGMILSIVGEQKVNAALRSFPEEIDFGTITQGTSKTCTVRVARWDKSAVRFEHVRFADDHLRVIGLLDDREKTEVTLQLQLDASDLALYDYYSTAFVSCLHPTFRELAIPVHAKVMRFEPHCSAETTVPAFSRAKVRLFPNALKRVRPSGFVGRNGDRCLCVG
ncbi:MAG: DUF1573 domain-containing protein [Thermoguttaceae bacterium]